MSLILKHQKLPVWFFIERQGVVTTRSHNIIIRVISNLLGPYRNIVKTINEETWNHTNESPALLTKVTVLPRIRKKGEIRKVISNSPRKEAPAAGRRRKELQETKQNVRVCK
jgi:hypothetical protein